MGSVLARRDYSLTGVEGKLAQERGIVAAEWYASPVSRKRMKELMKRRNGPAVRDTLIWFALWAAAGYWAYQTWGTWWSVLSFFVYGILYSAPGDSRWHECSHGTPFKTSWMNEAIYQLASFLTLRPATPWRWSHARHHTDTYIVGRDPEIVQPRPPIWRIYLLDYFRLYGGVKDVKRMFIHLFGKIPEDQKAYIPESEYGKVYWEARAYVFIFVLVVAWCAATHSIMPAMFIILPSFYGAFPIYIFGLVQHLGLYEDVIDHRLNSRTVYMNPVFRFLYWNMNYHIEHHMFPMVPYHALPALHEEMKSDCPPASPNLWKALREVHLALRKQKIDPKFVIDRPLPETARPYRFKPEPTVRENAHLELNSIK